MADQPDFYEILQVHPKASPLMIKKAYRTLLLAGAHPDLGGNKTATQLINEAYETLSDPDRRLAYDRRRGVGREKPTTILISICPHCGVYNRVLSETRLLIARCGKCSKPLGKLGTSRIDLEPKGSSWPWKWIWGGLVGVLLVSGGIGAYTFWNESRDPLAEAVALQERGQLSGAAEHLQAILAADPRQLTARLRLGMVLEEQKKFEAAITEYRKAVEQQPTMARAHYLLGKAQSRLGRYPDAEAELRRAIELDPQEVGSLVALGNLLVRTDHSEEAVRVYRRAIPLDARNSDLYFNLGAVHQLRSEHDEAIEAYQHALAIEPRHREAMVNLGRIYQARGDLQEALVRYQRATLLRYDDPELHFRMADLYRATGDRNRAMQELRVCQGQAKGNAILAERAQRAMQTMGDPN